MKSSIFNAPKNANIALRRCTKFILVIAVASSIVSCNNATNSNAKTLNDSIPVKDTTPGSSSTARLIGSRLTNFYVFNNSTEGTELATMIGGMNDTKKLTLSFFADAAGNLSLQSYSYKNGQADYERRVVFHIGGLVTGADGELTGKNVLFVNQELDETMKGPSSHGGKKDIKFLREDVVNNPAYPYIVFTPKLELSALAGVYNIKFDIGYTTNLADAKFTRAVTTLGLSSPNPSPPKGSY